MLSATVGVASLAWSGLARWTDYGAIWWTWWLGNAMGALLVTPLLLSWSTTRRWPWRRSGFLEALLVFLAVVCLGLLVFVGLLPNSAQQPLAFLGVPLLAWLAFRSSQREVTTTVAVLAGIALWGTLHGFGPFARERSNVALLLLQTFMGVTAVTTTVVAAVVAELKDAKGALMQLNEALEQRVQERTTDLEEAMAERQRLEQEAQRVHYFALLGRLAAGISHDIRNPLASVSLQLEVLEEELRQPSPEGPAYITQAFAEIKTNLVRLENLVQDYLSLVRVAAIRTEPLELGAFVTQFAQEMTATLAAHGITLHLEGLDQLGIVALHPNTFRRVLLNMTQNALDAMPHGGTLTLEGRGTATEVQLRIRDTGSGITAEHLPQMFEPLYTTKPGGTGLGLYIVQEIVAAHKGHVTVESVAGQGTTMTLTMPRLLTAATAPAVQ
jgi:signal transduction histidine kinase